MPIPAAKFGTSTLGSVIEVRALVTPDSIVAMVVRGDPVQVHKAWLLLIPIVPLT